MPPRHRRPVVARVIPDTEPSNPAATSRLGRWARRRETFLRYTAFVCIAVLLIVLACMGKSGGSEPADAAGKPSLFGVCPFSADKAPPTQPYRSGVDAMIPATNPTTGAMVSTTPNQAYGNVPATAFEQYGMSGLMWSRYTDDCWSTGNSMTNELANEALAISKAIAAVEISLFKWASSPDLMTSFLKPVDCLINGCGATGGNGLKDKLFLEFLQPVIVLGALYMAWVGLAKKRTVEAMQSAAWMFCCAVFALVFMAQPSAIANGANTFVASIDNTVISTVAGAMGSNSSDDICYLPSSAPNAGQRMASCSVYESIAYTPWAVGQWGTATPGGGVKVRLGNRTVDNVALAQIDAQATSHDEAVTGASTDKKAEWSAVQKVAEKSPNYSTWKGDQAGDRIGVSVLSYAAAGTSGLIFVIVSFATVIMAVGMIMLILSAPLFLLVGVHPGFGRGVALKWLELLIGTVVKRIVLGFVLALLVGFDEIVQAMNAPWLAKLAMIEAVAWSFFLFRKPLMKAFNIVTFKGATATGLEEGGQKFSDAGKKAVNVGVGAATGGATAAAGGGSFMAGAKAGGMRGLRSGGGTLRTASSSAAAGRRVAAQAQVAEQAQAAANTPRPPQDDSDDPFAYDKAKREQERARRLAEQYKDDQEMQRRLRIYFERNPTQEPTQGMTARTVPNPSRADPAMAETLDDIRRGQADTDRKVDEVKRNTDGDPAGRIPRPPNRG